MAVKKIENYNIHQNPATNENQFDVENYLNKNWNKTKEAVNNNADELISVQEELSTLEQGMSDIEEEQIEQNTNIESLQTELEKVEKEFNDYAIHGQASGEFIHLTDSSNLECDIKIKGNVKQDGEPTLDTPVEVQAVGNNINLLHMQEKSYIQLGVNVTQKESCLKLDGTTNGAQNILSGGYVGIGNFKKGKHIFKVHTSGSYKRYDKDDFAIYIREKNNTSKSYGVITGTNIEKDTNSFIFELTEDTDLVIQIWINASGIIFSKFEMKLKIEKGEKATSYSPYGQGSVKVTSCNKNIFNKNDEQLEINKGKYHMKGQIQTNNQYSYLLIKPIKSNTVYSYSGAILSSKSVIVYDFYKDDEYLSNINKNSANGQITVPENCNSIYVSINIEDINTFQIEIDKNITDYKQHESKSVTVPIQKEMLEEDYIDKENKKEVHNWLTVTLDGVQNIARYKHKTIENEERSFFQFNITGKGNGFSGGADSIYCDKLKAFEGAANNAINQECIWNEEGQYFYISINKSRLETDDTEGMNKFLQENPMQVYCTRAETLELDLTQEQIEALEKLDEMQTYKNITNITTDSIAILDVDYKKDLETWQKQQDDRITALEELLSTTQTSAMLVENLENDLLKEVE